MKTVVVVFLVTVLFPGSFEEARWPTHTVCKKDGLEVYYTSCDPLQDFGMSFEPCPPLLSQKVNIRVSLILRQDIKNLYLTIEGFANGKPVIQFHYTLCDPSFERLSFCGKKRGELIYYEGAVKIPLPIIPRGHFDITLLLLNQNHFGIVCANVTIIKT
ncbi:lymphocyte antigen 86 isoform X1 [Polyodon spathula]|uniref:lymphocyte antigen 86 isoform X1 n=1 Tax=Polyodon spathula TaxID=7913 RepID=UPI001B7E61CA|nr:lymphocyte antigen 86 isoform X1 [Polyodon spathula]